MIHFQFPIGADQFPAAAFTQDGQFILAGTQQECEAAASEAAGLYCWWNNGRPVIRFDFEMDAA